MLGTDANIPEDAAKRSSSATKNSKRKIKNDLLQTFIRFNY